MITRRWVTRAGAFGVAGAMAAPRSPERRRGDGAWSPPGQASAGSGDVRGARRGADIGAFRRTAADHGERRRRGRACVGSCSMPSGQVWWEMGHTAAFYWQGKQPAPCSSPRCRSGSRRRSMSPGSMPVVGRPYGMSSMLPFGVKPFMGGNTGICMGGPPLASSTRPSRRAPNPRGRTPRRRGR